MKRLFLADMAIILMLTISCSTTTFTEKVVMEAEALGTDEKIERYEEALEKERSLPISYNLAFSLYEKGEAERALEVLDEALRLNPDSMRLYSAELYGLKITKNSDKALRLLEIAVTKWPGDEKFTSAWLEALSRTEDERAHIEAEKAIRRFPTNQSAINILAENSTYWSEKKKTAPNPLDSIRLPFRSSILREIFTRILQSRAE